MKIVQILIKKVPPVNSEELVDLKNIESPVCLWWIGWFFPPGLDDQFGDYELQENSRPVIKKEVAMTPAGIGRGGGAPPTSQFSVGIGRGMLRG